MQETGTKSVNISPNRPKYPCFSLVIIFSVLFACLLIAPAVHAGKVTIDGKGDGIILATPGNAGEMRNNTAGLNLILFFDHNCGECQRVIAFLPGFLETHPGVAINSFDIADNQENHDLFHQYSERFGRANASVPAMLAGEQELVGYEEITSGLDAGIAAAKANGTLYPRAPLPETTPGVAETSPQATATLPEGIGYQGNETDALKIILFYNHSCHECQRVLEFLPDFLKNQTEVAVISYDIGNNPGYNDLFQRYNDRYGKPFSAVPAVFVGEQELVGYDEIISGLDAGIAAAKANGTLSPLTPVPTPTPGTNQSQQPSKGSSSALTVPLIITAALVDGINPCAFAVLVFLLVTLIALESRRKVLAVGGAYTLAVFIFYFLSGLGIFAFVQVTGLSTIFSLAAAVVALIAGLLMLRDAFGTNKPILAIPESRKATIDAYIRKSSIPAAFILGILVGMFELPCTGGIYLAILSLLSQSMSLSEGIPYLLLYNVVFVVPLLIIIVIVSWGLSPERLASFRDGNRRLIRFAMAMVMIAIAVFLIYTALQ